MLLQTSTNNEDHETMSLQHIHLLMPYVHLSELAGNQQMGFALRIKDQEYKTRSTLEVTNKNSHVKMKVLSICKPIPT
jgi:hypothetical protein